MAVNATRTISIGLSGDVSANETIAAAANPASPGGVNVVTLNAGSNNTVSVPSGATGVTIVKPAGAGQLTLKGVNGDTGILLHLTDPDSISLASGVTSFVLFNGGNVSAFHLIWT